MRGRLLLFPALLLLTTLPPAQAETPADAFVDTSDLSAVGIVGDDTSGDPCLSPKAALENPRNAIVVAVQCTAKVTVQWQEGGAVITVVTDQMTIVITGVADNGTVKVDVLVTVLLGFVSQTQHFVLECRDLPTFPVRQWDSRCTPWRDPAWD